MKVILNADWLKGEPNAKHLWLWEIRSDFEFLLKDAKMLADFFWKETDNLTKGTEIVVDVADFPPLVEFGPSANHKDRWVSYSKAIKPFYTEEDKRQMAYEDNPFLWRQEQLREQTEQLMALVPDERKEEATVILKRILEIQTSLSFPVAMA
jgi:hypothetical protein